MSLLRAPASTWWSAAAPLASAPLLPVLRRSCRDVERFIFCATTGRSGSEMLSAVLAAAEGAVALHEPFPVMNSYVLEAASTGRRKRVELAWRCLKLPTILKAARNHRLYAETNHQFVKVFAGQAQQEFGPRLAVIHLVRDRLAVARSLQELGHVPGTHRGSRWVLDPGAATNLVPFRIAEEHGLTHPLQRCLWYCLETEARVVALRRSLSPACPWVELDVEELNSEEGLRRLDAALDLRLASVAAELSLQRLNRKPKLGRERERLSDRSAAELSREFLDAYADWA